MTDWTKATPAAYSAAKKRRMVERWNSPLGLAVRRMAPTAWPGVPASALIGFTCSVSRDTSNTTDTARAQRFHEVGAYQIEAGLRDGPAPNPDPRAKYNRWGRLHNDPRVVALLGRPATMTPDGWKTAPEDQAAVGLINLREHLDGITGRLPPALRPSSPATRWAVAISFSAFSRGASGAWSRLKPAADVLAAVDESERWASLVHWIATSDDPAAKVAGKPGVARMVMRTLWKTTSGEVLARAVGDDVAWYGVRSLDDESAVTRRAFGV